ncbi:MAG: CoB--CoM heterodisulfide reductase iron-sulfur subunit B family protein [Dehalococcoidia bacterium]|nr:CoB--CoM heterodisulfide reductase iron-sulfur subunit B family protein [Dehalococcoidia bacterium]
MKYAYFTGCVAKGTTPELNVSTLRVAEKLGIELEEMKSASCCGAGMIEEYSEDMARALNGRTLALAERDGLDILTICNVCTLNLRKANKELKEDPEVMERTNQVLGKVGLQYKGGVDVTQFLWALVRDFGLDKLKAMVKHPLTGFKVAPFYGCQILRPSELNGFDDPNNPTSLESVITALGAEPVDYDGKTKCCGFLLLTVYEETSLAMTGKHLQQAKEAGANCMVTPCPLCHINLDIYQSKIETQMGTKIDLPIFHLPQLVGLALGIAPAALRLTRNMVNPYKLLHEAGVR